MRGLIESDQLGFQLAIPESCDGSSRLLHAHSDVCGQQVKMTRFSKVRTCVEKRFDVKPEPK